MKYAFLAIIVLLFVSCGDKEPVKRRFFRMDTVTDLTLYPQSLFYRKKTINRTVAEIDSLLLDWENRFSAEKNNSEVYRVNNRVNDTVTVSPEFYQMLSKAIAYADTLHGAFDVTLLPLKKFWDITCSECKRPDPINIEDQQKASEIVANTGWQNITLLGRNQVVFLGPAIQIDVGGIAKGAVLNELIALLERKRYKNFIISAGGDIVTRGKKPDGSLFKVGVQNPRGEGLSAVFTLENGVVVTSGDYERYRFAGSGTRVHHLFDPQSGLPAEKNISLTIKGDDPVEVDIISTALFSWSVESILSYIENRKHLECMIITKDQDRIYSSGFLNLLN